MQDALIADAPTDNPKALQGGPEIYAAEQPTAVAADAKSTNEGLAIAHRGDDDRQTRRPTMHCPIPAHTSGNTGSTHPDPTVMVTRYKRFREVWSEGGRVSGIWSEKRGMVQTFDHLKARRGKFDPRTARDRWWW